MLSKRILIFGYSGSIHIQKWVMSLAERGYAVCVISLEGDKIPGVDVVRFSRFGKLSYLKHASKAAKAALEFKPDIVHVHYAGGYGIWGVKTRFHPLVLSVWGSDVESLPKSFFYRPFIKSVLTHADKITATSESLKKSTINVLESSKGKIDVIPFGVSVPDSTSELPITDFCSAIYLKHLEAVYAPDILIQATALVIDKFPDFKLSICGNGSMKEQLIKLVQNLKLEKNIQLLGYIESSEVYELIKQHHFMVMPSLKEGFGVAAVEACACARPIVATNVGGIPEIVTDGHNGYLVNPNSVQELADGMLKMISDRERMIEMGRNGYEIAKQKFDWEKSVDQMCALYESL